jgi:Uma2 family endonuclease
MTDTPKTSTLIHYPESDGQPMAESDITRDYLMYCVEALELYFQSRRNVYVSGNSFIYYREGDPRAAVSPDVFVVFGVHKRKRRSYKVWQEGNKLPDFVLEITSFSTKRQDEIEKLKLYESLKVQEYFQYDPTGDYLNPQIKGSTLVDGHYQPLPLQQLDNDIAFIHSAVLSLDLRLQPAINPALMLVSEPVMLPRELRLYDPQAGTTLLNYQEVEQAREQAEQAREQAEQAREQAEQAREQAEQARQDAIPRLLALGLSPDQVAEALGVTVAEVQPYLG